MALKYTLINPARSNSILYSTGQEKPFQQLKLTITRETKNTLAFSTETDQPSASNYFLALGFEAGFLKNPEQITIAPATPENEGSEWKMYYERNKVDNSDFFYLLPTNKELIFNDHQPEYSFLVSGIEMEDGIGPTNIRTEFKYANFKIGERPPSIPMTREKYFMVIPFSLGSKIPLQARLIDNWNFLPGGGSGKDAPKTLKIEVSINPDFSSWHTTPDDPDHPENFEIGYVIEGNNKTSQIALETSNEALKIIEVSAINWDSSIPILKIGNKLPKLIDSKNPLIITTILESESIVSIDYLVLSFFNFKNKNTGEIFAPFDLHVPIYSGPLSVEEGNLNIGSSLFPTETTINSDVIINNPIFNLKLGEFHESENDRNSNHNPNNQFQVFTASESGMLAAIDILITDKHHGGGSLEIYEGTESDPAKFIHKQDYGNLKQGWNLETLMFSKLIPVVKDKKYRVNFTYISAYIIPKTERAWGSTYSFHFRTYYYDPSPRTALVVKDGNVGIGTNTPDGKLTIKDDSKTSLIIQTPDNTKSNGIAFQNAGRYFTWNIFRKNVGDSKADLIIGGGQPKENVDELDERLRIDTDGNVEITTTLEVAGSIKASSLDVKENINSASLSLTGLLNSSSGIHLQKDILFLRGDKSQAAYIIPLHTGLAMGENRGGNNTSLTINAGFSFKTRESKEAETLERLQISNKGKVTISGSLDVGGTVNAKKLVIKADNKDDVGINVAGIVEANTFRLNDKNFLGFSGKNISLYNDGHGFIVEEGGHTAHVVGKLTVGTSIEVIDKGESKDITKYRSYPNGNISKNDQNVANVLVGLYTKYRVVASEFNATSDARIKSIIGHSDAQQDLSILKLIEITDYKFKDPIAKGNRLNKKVIGQQIAKIFPQAVHTNGTEVIPDIMQSSVVEEDGWILLAGTGIKAKEKVRLLFFEPEESVLAEVLEVNDQGFQVATDKKGKVFVYGREVDDFHIVDYDALSMLHISATQALIAQIDSHEKRLSDIEQQLKSKKNGSRAHLDKK